MAISVYTIIAPRPPFPPRTPLKRAKTSTATKLGISHLMIPLMEALRVSHLSKKVFAKYRGVAHPYQNGKNFSRRNYWSYKNFDKI